MYMHYPMRIPPYQQTLPASFFGRFKPPIYVAKTTVFAHVREAYLERVKDAHTTLALLEHARKLKVKKSSVDLLIMTGVTIQ